MMATDIVEGKLVTIPFQPEFEELMLEGRKTATTRTKWYGRPGDRFMAFGHTFVLIEVRRLKVGQVADRFFEREGFRSPDEFLRCWRSLHPRIGEAYSRTVYLHLFSLAKNAVSWHVHQYFGGNVCLICGFGRLKNE